VANSPSLNFPGPVSESALAMGVPCHEDETG